MTGTTADAAAVIAFWFAEKTQAHWFAADEDFDAAVTALFAPLWQRARTGDLAAWEADAESALALVLVLDQAPRNMFRGDARAFSTDDQAREVARRAVARGLDLSLTPQQRAFLYLPFMHSEDLDDQDDCVRLMEAIGLAEQIHHAHAHREIITRFGRFPHRNAVLERPSTPEESRFLEGKSPY